MHACSFNITAYAIFSNHLNKSNWESGLDLERDELAHQSGANWSILLSVGKFEAYIGDTETSTSMN